MGFFVVSQFGIGQQLNNSHTDCSWSSNCHFERYMSIICSVEMISWTVCPCNLARSNKVVIAHVWSKVWPIVWILWFVSMVAGWQKGKVNILFLWMYPVCCWYGWPHWMQQLAIAIVSWWHVRPMFWKLWQANCFRKHSD